LGCGARRNVLTKVESDNEDLAEPDSAKYESVALTPDEKNGFQPRGFLVTTFREMYLSRIFFDFLNRQKILEGQSFFSKQMRAYLPKYAFHASMWISAPP